MRERRAAFLLWREEKAGRREASRSGSSASELPMTASTWTDDRIGRLKTLWLAGQTAEQIARDLANGITRSAVLGKVHRMGLSAGRSGRPPKRPEAGPKPSRLAPTRSLADRPIDARPVVATEHGLATVLSVRRCQCRWPFGAPGAADFSLCGQPVTRGAFCASHAAVAYRPAADTPRTLDRLARLN